MKALLCALQTEALNKFALFVQTAYSNPKPATPKPRQAKEHPEEKVIVPFNECPSGNEASQLSTDSFCEQVYLDLQQQLEDDPKEKVGPSGVFDQVKTFC